MATVGWWASGRPLHLAFGRRLGSRRRRWRSLLLPTAHRTRHMYTVGSSGSGKSRFARHLLYQDIRANRSWTLVDPQDLQREVLGYIAELALGPGTPTAARIEQLGDKLVIIEPADQRFGVPGINLLEVADGQVAYQLVDSIIEIIREIWPDTFGPRLEDVCRNGLLLLQELGLTVLEVLPLLSDTTFRQTLVNRSTNRELRLYFEGHLGGLRASDLKTWVESSRNKWNAFLANPFIRPLLGQSTSTVSFRQVIDEGKWLIVNVSRDKLKESRRLLGALLVALIHNAAIGREHIPPHQRYFHALFVDEFQEFYSPSFLHILEGGRKYGLGLSLFHQNLTQPPFDQNAAIVDTILANTHTRVAFSLGRKDADRLTGELFSPSGIETQYQRCVLGIPTERPQFWSLAEEREHYTQELLHQRTAEAYLNFKGFGDDDPYVCRMPVVPDVAPDDAKIDILRQRVAARYYRPLDDINEEIRVRQASIMGAPPRTPPGTVDYNE